METERLALGVALLNELPRFTPAQYQRLFEDAGLRGAKASLFLRDSHAYSPWTMVVDCDGCMIDLEAFTVPLPSSVLEQASASEELQAAARGHACRVEVSAVRNRCRPELAHENVARVAAGLLRTTYAIAWFHRPSGILLPAGPTAQKVREAPRGQLPVELFASLRESERGPMRLLDTLGLAGFDLQDVEIEVDAADADGARSFLAELAATLVAHRQSLQEGQVVAGPLGLPWKAHVAMASVPPARALLRLELAS